MVELQPSKLDVAGSNPVSRSAAPDDPTKPKEDPKTRVDRSYEETAPHAHVAQLVEHVLGKDEVTRSIRVVGSKEAAFRTTDNALLGRS